MPLEAVETPEAVDAPTPVEEVADLFVALMRTSGRARARFLAMAEHDVEWSSQILLRCLAAEGPMRAGALADCVHSDPSTISRQVAAMVKEGLVERRADPADGRASILAPTAKAAAVIAAHEANRVRHFEDMLGDWSERDLTRFATLLRRFTDDFDRASARYLTERPRSAEGN